MMDNAIKSTCNISILNSLPRWEQVPLKLVWSKFCPILLFFLDGSRPHFQNNLIGDHPNP